MKRRVLIAKALAHEPEILFLDEPTAGVDVELRRDMWNLVRQLRASGVTIILTTHYIEEAEEMADRVGVINKGEIILVEEKTALMKKLGRKTLTVQLSEPLEVLPKALDDWDLQLNADGHEIEYVFDTKAERTGISALLGRMSDLGIGYKDLKTEESRSEEHTSELQSLMRISYAVFCWKKKNTDKATKNNIYNRIDRIHQL